MINYFLTGLSLYLSLFVFRIVLGYSLSKIYKEKFSDVFEFNILPFISEALFYGLIFAAAIWVIDEYNSEKFVAVLSSVFFISLIPTYLFIISPIQYVFSNSTYRGSQEEISIQNDILKKYRVRIIDKNIVNAYATGIIPFSKTILIGRPLVDNLNSNELLSIVLHEAGHLKLNHLYKLYLANLLVSAFSYILFQFRSAYFSNDNIFLDSLSVFFTGCFVGLLIYYIPGKFQYVFELQADSFSALHNGKDNLKMSLTKLDELSNGDVSKGGITHPTLDKRLLNIQ